MIYGAEARAKFRSRVAWKNFRAMMIESTRGRCQCCGMYYAPRSRRMLNVHHLDPDQYDDLQPGKFRVLCVTCHEFVEYMDMRIKGKAFKYYDRFSLVFLGLRDCLTYTAQRKGDELLDGQETIIFNQETGEKL